ncbi:MAG: phosphotransferase, partial [Pseudomonas sp.]
MPLATLVHRASLPSPQISAEQALVLLRLNYGLSGDLRPLGSHQDLNYRVDSERGRYVLKICHGDYAIQELQAQHAALKQLAGHSTVKVPRVIEASNGQDLLTLDVAGQTVHVRLLEYIEGQSLTQLKHLTPDLVTGLGRLCAEMNLALASFDHPGLERTLQWDARHAAALVDHLLPVIQDNHRRQLIAD